jgi:hypothetical protein
LINILFKEGLINFKTYQKIQEEYKHYIDSGKIQGEQDGF